MKHELKIKPEFLADTTRQCGAMAELLRDIHEHIGASIPQTISEHYRGCDLLDRIDAVLTGKLPDHIADVSKMVAPKAGSWCRWSLPHTRCWLVGTQKQLTMNYA